MSPDNPDPVANAIGQMLDHMHLMDSKVQELCNAIQQMGGEVCTKKLPELNVDAFDEASREAATIRKQDIDKFDPSI